MANTNKKVSASGAMPIRPHLLRFILKKENLPETALFHLPGDNSIAGFLYLLLTTKEALRDDDRHHVPMDCTSELLFVLPPHELDRGRCFLTPTRVQRFNAWVHALMHEVLFTQILAGQLVGMEEKEIIYRFINQYELFDLQFDALKKASTRYRVRKGFPLFREKKSEKKAENHWRNVRTIAQKPSILLTA